MPAPKENTLKPAVVCAATLVVLALLPLGAQTPAPTAPGVGQAVACRALEVHTSEDLKLTLVVFHQREENQRSPLATLLREHSGAAVEFQTADGHWHPATVLRLKSCFGRGLLLFPAGAAPLAERDAFLLRFP